MNSFAGRYSHMDLPTSHSTQQVSPERIQLSYKSSLLWRKTKQNRHGNYLEISGRAIAHWGKYRGRLRGLRVYLSVGYLCRFEIALQTKNSKEISLGNLVTFPYLHPCLDMSTTWLSTSEKVPAHFWPSSVIYLYKLVFRKQTPKKSFKTVGSFLPDTLGPWSLAV